MPLTNDSYRLADYYSSSQTHRQSLRSDNVMVDNTPGSSPPRFTIDIKRSLWSRRRDSFHIIPPVPQVPTKAFTYSSPKGFVDIAGASSDASDFPIVPVRPPLRPTVSFGSASDVSFYSPTSSEFGKKSVFVLEQEIDPDREQSTSESSHDWRYYAVFTCLALLNLACDLSATVLSTALPAVSHDLDLNTLQAFWIPGAMFLSAALLQPLFMRLAQAFGNKFILLLGIVVFVAGSTMSALTTRIPLLLAGQCVQGVGVGAISILTELTLGQISSSLSSQPTGRRAWIRSTSHLFRIGLALGPILGGACAQTVGWRSAFWIQTILSGLALFGLPFLPHLPQSNPDRLPDRLGKVDFFGWALLAAAVSTMTTSIFWSGLTYSWSSYHTWVPLSVGFTCLTIWCLYTGHRIEPILPMAVSQNLTAVVSCFSACIHGAISAAIIYFCPIFFQVVGMQPVMSGLSLAPWTLGIVALSVVSSATTRAAGARYTAWTGWVLTTSGCGLMIMFSQDTTAAVSVPIGMLGGIGLGLLFSSLTTAFESAGRNDDDSTHAAPMLIYLNTLGQCFGVLASGAIFMTAMNSGVSDNKYLGIGAATYTRDAMSFIKIINTTILEPQGLHSALVTAYTQSLRYVWIFTCAIAALALLSSVCFPKEEKKPAQGQRPLTPMLPELEG